MNEDTVSQPVNILLSREEVLFVLNLLQASFLPGLDADPLGELSEEQQALAVTVAGRALLARELIRIPGEGELLVHPALLTAVGVCAYPEKAVFAYHWSPGQAAPDRFFGYVRGPETVVHTRPEEVLHLFSVLPSTQGLIEGVLSFCHYADSPAAAPLVLDVPSAQLAEVRQLAEAGQAGRAVELLKEGSAPEAARDFVATLAARPHVSILQLLKQGGPNEAEQQDLTLVQNSHHAWLISAPAAAANGTALQVKTAGRAEVESLLAGWLG